MTTPELERALTGLAEPAPAPELAANVMARIAREEDEAPQPADIVREPGLRWMPVVPGALLVVGVYLYGLAQALVEDAEGLLPPVPASDSLAALPFDPVVLLLATGLLLCLGPLLPRPSERPPS